MAGAPALSGFSSLILLKFTISVLAFWYKVLHILDFSNFMTSTNLLRGCDLAADSPADRFLRATSFA